MRFFYYCFYRISKAYEWWESNPYMAGNALVAIFFAFNILSVLSFLLVIIGNTLSNKIIIITIISCAVINLFIMTKKKYEQFCERWKDEKYKTFKGSIVILYIVATFLLFFVSFYADVIIGIER